MTDPREVRAVAERAARTSYGRLVALLAAPARDIAGAEDALGDAFERALRTWPVSGIPDNPEGWLLTVARNRRRDEYGSAAYRTSVPIPEDDRELAASLPSLDGIDPDAIGDKRLELLFACAHPAVDTRARTPLLLQAVLGFDAAQIGAAFAIPTATMAQRLVRAKRRIRDARIPFSVPGRADRALRLPAVLEAIYGCYAIDRGLGSSETRMSLAAEAQYLAVTVAALLGDEPEAWALAALVTLSLARTPPVTVEQYIPLDEQDTTDWDRRLIAEGDTYLHRASMIRTRKADGPVGRFELEAAIQSAHDARARTGTVDRQAVRTLSEALVLVAPSLGARVALASAVARCDGPLAGLASLNGIEDATLDRFQPAWATRAALLAEAGATAEAVRAYTRAIDLTPQPQVRAWLIRRRDQLLPR
ncbi:RNA polymerase sigma factor [Leifsonia poae]|uniref:RNA polymerase sigma factor n=1 Tax=Leifsonia poae TaxID=110933 RepID=UPI001CBF104F|nr:DUF6596 domain-containing protein [Leifsonia poae]